MSNKLGSCQIHLTEPARTAAAEATFPKAGVPAYDIGAERNRREFKGPHFTDCVASVLFDQGFVHVTLEGADKVVYSYPANTVARVKSYRNPE
ncbi:hypothetical protein [Pseudomonas phage Misse]|nr:hypothetical protein [Pseudomonas phage Misse]